MSLFRLAYLSSPRITGSSEDYRVELADILLSARYNNPVAEITGVLLVNPQHFAQVLEGDRQAVETLYRHIAEDPRHQNLVILFANDVETRMFPDWSMAYLDLTHQTERQVERLAGAVPSEMRVEAQMMLRSLSRMMRADAAA